MEAIKKVITTEEIVGYKSFDGQEFKEKEECEKYERSAIGVLKKQFMELVIKEMEVCDITNCGSLAFSECGEDWYAALIKIKNAEDLKICNMYWELINSKSTVKFTNEMIGKEILVRLGDGDWCYPYGTIEECVERYRTALMKFKETEVKSNEEEEN